MGLWKYPSPDRAAWHFPMLKTQKVIGPGSPLISQVEHFCKVINNEEEPRSSARDAANTLSATLAILEAAKTGKVVSPRKI